jgi:hypothetical protein
MCSSHQLGAVGVVLAALRRLGRGTGAVLHHLLLHAACAALHRLPCCLHSCCLRRARSTAGADMTQAVGAFPARAAVASQGLPVWPATATCICDSRHSLDKGLYTK